MATFTITTHVTSVHVAFLKEHVKFALVQVDNVDTPYFHCVKTSMALCRLLVPEQYGKTDAAMRIVYPIMLGIFFAVIFAHKNPSAGV